VFFGSGPVALNSLKLLQERFTIEAIITKPATQSVMQYSFPSTRVYTVSNRAELDQLITSNNFRSTFAILIDFGILISQSVIDAFPLGIINSHFSLLPEWRGADPITFSILSGQAITGVSLMLVSKGMDEGPLLAQAPYDIPENIALEALTDNLIILSDRTLKAVIPDYLEGKIVAAPQQKASLLAGIKPTYSRRLIKEDGKIDWAKPAVQLEREIRAYSIWPHSYTALAGRDVIITQARVAERKGSPGEVRLDRSHLYICCGQHALEIVRLKPAGKPEMSSEAFLAGYKRFL
jgi:methionyl-tRNA formyltransferase